MLRGGTLTPTAQDLTIMSVHPLARKKPDPMERIALTLERIAITLATIDANVRELVKARSPTP
jgi:hypothetical protein